MSCKLHRVHFYNPKPESINCASFNKINKSLALARADASIEIWDLNYSPYPVNFIPGVKNSSVEALGWVNNRLLSTGLGGALLEWDLNTLKVKNTVILTGYAAWCLDVNSTNTLVAVGTEQGYINLYNLNNDEIVYEKLFDKQEGRIMCCKFDKTGNTLVTGSINTIRVWNVETGHATCRISVSRRGKETIVWCLAVLSDNMVVSGDSHGRLTFWDSSVGDQIESYTTHKSDILSIVVSEDENSLYCSGVDPVIMNFKKVSNGCGKISGAQWVKNVQRNIHEHDVRVLILNGENLVSVGADGYLTLSKYPPKWVMRIPPMIPGIRSSVCAQKKLLLLRYSTHLEIWKLGTYEVNESGNVIISNVSMEKNFGDEADNPHLEPDTAIADYKKVNMDSTDHLQQLKVLEKPVLFVTVIPKKNKQILCCELSPNGQFIVYSTDSYIRMLKLDTEDESNISLTKVLISGLSSICDRIAFSEDSQTMLVHSCGEIRVLHVDSEAGATIVQTISTEKYLKSKTALHFHLSKKTSSNMTYLAVADTEGGIVVWTQSNKKFEHHVTLPKYRCVPSALSINSKNQCLIVAYVDQKLVEYDLLNKKFTNWPGGTLPPQWLSRQNAVASINVHSKRDALVFEDITSLFVIDKSLQTIYHEPKAKKSNSNSLDVYFKIIPFKYLAGFHWMGDDEAVILEILPENIVSQLPPALASKRHNMG